MTDLQVKYQQLQELKRANQAQEALKQSEINVKEQEKDIKSRQTDVAAAEADIKKAQLALSQGKLPYEIEKLASETAINKQTKENLVATLTKIYADIDNIRSDTNLQDAQRYTEYTKAVQNGMSILRRLGLPWMGDIQNNIHDLISSLMGGIGKGVGGLIG